MTDKEYNATKRRVFAIAKKWQQALGLCWWEIAYDWCQVEMESDKHNITVRAVAVTQWEYAKASIALALPVLMELSDRDIERVVVHEFMHILVNEMGEPDADGKHQERVVTGLTKAIFWLLASDIMKKGKT